MRPIVSVTKREKIDEDKRKVQVIAVIYNKRDQIDQLSKTVKNLS